MGREIEREKGEREGETEGERERGEREIEREREMDVLTFMKCLFTSLTCYILEGIIIILSFSRIAVEIRQLLSSVLWWCVQIH